MRMQIDELINKRDTALRTLEPAISTRQMPNPLYDCSASSKRQTPNVSSEGSVRYLADESRSMKSSQKSAFGESLK